MSSQPNQSLIDGIRCFQELTTSNAPLGNRELADRLGINVVKVNRLLMTLKSIGLTEQGSNRKYRPGPAVHLLAAQSLHSSVLFRASASVLSHYQYEDRIVAMGVLWKDSVVYMYHATPGQSAFEGLGGYHLYQATQSSIGQVLLADLNDEELQSRLADSEQTDEYTRQFLKHVSEIREQGYSCICNPENGLYNISMKVGIDGAEAGIAFSDLDITAEQLPTYVDQLKELVEKIEQGSSQPSH